MNDIPQNDGMLPDVLVPHSKEWYTLCERRFAVDRITISGELAEAIVSALGPQPYQPNPPEIVMWSSNTDWYFVATLHPTKKYEEKPVYETLDPVVRVGSPGALGDIGKFWKFVEEKFDFQKTSRSEMLLEALDLPTEDAHMPLSWHINRHLRGRG